MDPRGVRVVASGGSLCRTEPAHRTPLHLPSRPATAAAPLWQGDLISQSATIQEDYDEVFAYLEGGGAKGTLMLGLALFAWYCTVSQEVNATIDSYHVTRSIPYGNTTKIHKHKQSGEFTVVQLSKERLAIRVFVSLLRLVTAAFMFYQGTQFLVYTIDIGDLLLNAVALEFVISTDELIFMALAPSRAKRVIRRTKGFNLQSANTWRGIDRRSALTVLMTHAGMVWAAAVFMQPQLDILHRVKHAVSVEQESNRVCAKV